jgi:hypothetical protein
MLDLPEQHEQYRSISEFVVIDLKRYSRLNNKDETDYEDYDPYCFMLEIDRYMIGTNSDDKTWETIDEMQANRSMGTWMLLFMLLPFGVIVYISNWIYYRYIYKGEENGR